MEPRSKMLDFFPRPLASQHSPDFMAGGGEMGERIRSHDWAPTSLGAARDWPQGGGTIEVASEGHLKGSEFIVRLPVRTDAAPAGISGETGSRAASPMEPRVGRGPMEPRVGHRILVADDNADSAATLSIMLEALGNEVRVAHDGREAVEMAEQFRPDVILLDIGMPRMNGYDACEEIRRRPWAATAFVAALTGWVQDEDKSRSRAAGFDRHLVKPVEPAAIETLIRDLPPPKG